jgi:glutamate synthase domain-containing protein 1
MTTKPKIDLDNDPELARFLQDYQACKETPDGDADELARRGQQLRATFSDLFENACC